MGGGYGVALSTASGPSEILPWVGAVLKGTSQAAPEWPLDGVRFNCGPLLLPLSFCTHVPKHGLGVAPSAAAQDRSYHFLGALPCELAASFLAFPHWLPPFVAITEAGVPFINFPLAPVLPSPWVESSSSPELIACEPSVQASAWVFYLL